MIYDYLVVRFGEITLKGKNKKQFVVKLENDVRDKLRKFASLEIKRHFDDLEIKLNNETADDVLAVLKKVFGIQNIWPAIKVGTDIEDIREGVLRIANQEKSAETFKIAARRKDKRYPIHGSELNQDLGGTVLEHCDWLHVDVHDPDLRIRVDVGYHETHIYGKEVQGAGGLPVGASGKVMLLLSGGIDSPVAAYLVAKRGAIVEAVHFQSPPYTSDRAKQKVIDLAKKLREFGGKFVLHLVPFTEAQVAIRDAVPEDYRITIMRRLMFRIAEEQAARRGALALATGESLGQVASQTLESMNTINAVTNLPILRPLITMDKIDIAKIAKEIDTYEISIRPYEDCCTIFLPKAPRTRPDRNHAARFEQKLDVDALVREAVDGIETIVIDEDAQEDALSQLL
ncbi:tRNA uracil 4-sulfurtransferase ThiI [Sporolactobacillus inulinus]|uniref:Probable tRNA sulfurtransferase n=1 Tax=Sporolactobacillus inulinus CASD TaxID=1069536 RepID=A0A0U1QPY9_9BACL|nr:tRNA uracil 4-sulfurtransferase ThiI [Sporolactobacillus inulinus]KLI02860.1 thiamine biosynthesis protein ThiI [Sporolactobacillus inulinus CASD]GEB75731.1 putative tRNA sulfurtransferase [Sporolactobacillus inulinus]